MAINFPASPSTNDTHTENAITWIFNGTSWDAQDVPVTAASIGLGNVDNTADADKPVSTATQTALDDKQDILAEGAFVDGDKTKLDSIESGAAAETHPHATTGPMPRQGEATLIIRDGGTKTYNAFSSGILIGTNIYATVSSMTGHTSRDGDLWFYTSKNYGAGEWGGVKIFSATGITGAIVNGDKEYRYGGLQHLGGDDLMILIHTYVEGTGADVEWSVSNDLGNTWGSLQSLPDQGESTIAAAGNPFLFNGRVYCGYYGPGANSEYMVSQTLAEILAGTNDQWRDEWTGNGTENYLTTSPDGTELRSYSRVTDIYLRTTTDGDTWANDGYIGLPDWEQTQPTVEQLEDGTLVHFGRQDSLGLEARIYYKNSGAGQWVIADTPLNSPRTIPAWDSIEKNMYGSIIPFGGSMFGCIYALEADEEWNPVSQSTGTRCSAFYSVFSSGNGVSPLNHISHTSRAFDPRDLQGCNLLLTPESIVQSGGTVTAWTDLSDAGHSITTDSGKEPALAAAASPNGKDCVQGALGDYFVFAAAGGTWDIGSVYAVFDYPNANFNGFNAILPNVIQGNGTTDTLKFGAYQTDAMPGFTTINDVDYDASTYDPTAWARYATRMLLVNPTSATEDSSLMTKGGISRLMTQAGFDTNRNWLGKLVCFVTFDRRLTDSEDAQMRAWLAEQ